MKEKIRKEVIKFIEKMGLDTMNELYRLNGNCVVIDQTIQNLVKEITNTDIDYFVYTHGYCHGFRTTILCDENADDGDDGKWIDFYTTDNGIATR